VTAELVRADDDQTWADYHHPDADRDEVRDRLIIRYSTLVRYVASRMAATLPPSVDHGDLASYGLFGLIDAIDKFEPARGIRFETYAITRIRGSILDELRAMDWAPRSVRSRYRWVLRTQESLEQKHRRKPTYDEVANELGWPVAEVRLVLADAQGGTVISLQMESDHDDRASGPAAVREIEDLSLDDPVLEHELEVTTQLLAQGIASLPERERVVTTLYFREDQTLADIGRVLGVTESRVCQVYTNAALLLRDYLASHR
jgi:RNA polymerase sigma factor for flagellar operon FliA